MPENFILSILMHSCNFVNDAEVTGELDHMWARYAYKDKKF